MEAKRVFETRRLIFFGLLAAYCVLSFKLRFTFDLNDETEKLITAELLNSGLRLYKDIFVQHGPVVYLLSQFVYALGQLRDMAVQRWIPIVMSLLALAAVFFSPLLTQKRSRWTAGSLMLVGLLFTQCIYGLVMTMYQVYCGYFFVMALALFLLPVVLGRQIQRWQAIAAGFLMIMIFFCAFSFVIAIGCFSVAAILKLAAVKENRKTLLYYFVGVGLGLVSVCAWVFVYGDFKGYFISHIYFNLVYYKQFMAFSPFGAFAMLIPGLSAVLFNMFNSWYTHVLLLAIYAFWILLVWCRWKTLKLSELGALGLTFLSMIFMNPRMEVTLFASTVVIIVVAFVSMTFAYLVENQKSSSIRLKKCALAALAFYLSIGVLAQFLMKTQAYFSSPISYYHYKGRLGRMESLEMKFLREIAGPQDGVLQVPFNLNFYLWIDRLPAFGIYYWLPWQNKYVPQAIEGYRYDLCAQVRSNPPKLIRYSREHVWNIPPKTFLSCIEEVLFEKYLPLKLADKTWVRADLLAQKTKLNSAVISAIQMRRKLRSVGRERCVLLASLQTQTLGMGACDEESVLRWVSRTDELPDAQFTAMAVPELLCLDQSTSEPEGRAFRLWPCRTHADQALHELKASGGFRLQMTGPGQCVQERGQDIILADCESATVWNWVD